MEKEKNLSKEELNQVSGGQEVDVKVKVDSGPLKGGPITAAKFTEQEKKFLRKRGYDPDSKDEVQLSQMVRILEKNDFKTDIHWKY